MMALLGFFFSLRTQELFALRPMDFRAGSQASFLECCKVMGRFKLFSKFAVHVHRQRKKNGEFNHPKSYSNGWFSCFHEQGAKEIVKRLKVIEDKEQLIFDHLPDWNIKLWKRKGIPNITLKDLRRASLYWLGHQNDIDLVALKHHARHSKVDTTMLYLRRPGEEVDGGFELDLDG